MTTITDPRAARLARLKAMQDELAKVKTGYESNVLSLQSGVTVVRILPPVGNMNPNFYHSQVGYHMIGNTVVRCTAFTTEFALDIPEQICPICEVCAVLKKGSPADKELATSIRLNKKYWMNVIVRDKEDRFNTATGPLIYKAGVTVFDRTRSFVNDPDYGLIDDPEVGTDIKIEKQGEGRDTKYQVNTRKGDYQPLLMASDGSVDWEAVGKILEACQDLSCVLMPDDPKEDQEFLSKIGWNPMVKVFSYDRTVAQFGVSLDTIEILPEIIAHNMKKEGEQQESDGRYARPVRGSSNTPAPAVDKAAEIKARIAALSNKAKSV